MARIFFIVGFLMTACGGGSSSGPMPAPSETSSDEDVVVEEELEMPAPEPEPPADPTGTPAAETLNLVKYLLAPCASPLSFDVISRMKSGADLLEIKGTPEKKSVIVNGKPLWEVTPLAATSFEFDIDVKMVGTEKAHPSYVCSSIVTSFPDDNNDKIQRHTMILETNGAQPELSWHMREENGRPFVHKIEILTPGAAPIVLQ